MNYREIRMGGIPYLLELRGSSDWYWGTDYASGDLHEAEEIAGAGLELKSNRLCFVSFPDGEVYEPVRAGAGQYFAEPIACEGEVFCLLVDFIQRWIRLLRCTRDMKAAHVEVEIGLDRVADTYNLALDLSPLMIVRQGREAVFEILWPEPCRFEVSETESFVWREGDRLVFSRWGVGRRMMRGLSSAAFRRVRLSRNMRACSCGCRTGSAG
ncbi:MAG: hypothetical protein QM270_09240 [Bacillota bacterium]|nr:hypothetical protein [Bacillota bacterium]